MGSNRATTPTSDVVIIRDQSEECVRKSVYRYVNLDLLSIPVGIPISTKFKFSKACAEYCTVPGYGRTR